jgi:hypothetical protein
MPSTTCRKLKGRHGCTHGTIPIGAGKMKNISFAPTYKIYGLTLYHLKSKSDFNVPNSTRKIDEGIGGV